MVPEILESVHDAIGAVAIGAGAWIVLGHLTGKLLKRWPIVFLKCALVASASVLLFPFYHFLSSYLLGGHVWNLHLRNGSTCMVQVPPSRYLDSDFRIEHHAHFLSEHSGRATHIFEMLVST
jgi:hypothetical protein